MTDSPTSAPPTPPVCDFLVDHPGSEVCDNCGHILGCHRKVQALTDYTGATWVCPSTFYTKDGRTPPR